MVEIKWFGTAGLLFSAGGKSVLFDPYVPLNPALPAPDLSEFASCGDIFVTHGHFDHMIDIPKVLAAGGGPVFCPARAAETLTREGAKKAALFTIGPGDVIERGPFKITVFKGKHIRFDPKLILQTLFNRRIVQYRSNLRPLLRGARQYPAGEVLVYFIEIKGKKILHLGSLSLEESERYPERVDVLTIPYQGRSDLSSYALPLISRIRPKSLFLHHFDDSFPPVSSPVDVQPLKDALKRSHPGIRVIHPAAGQTLPLPG